MPTNGFLPCFSKYKFDNYPIQNLYAENSQVEKVKRLLSALVDTINPLELTKKYGVGKEIQTIRPDSRDGKQIIKMCSFPYNLYRIDYGDTPFRIIFGITNEPRIAYIFAFDTKHSTFSGKRE